MIRFSLLSSGTLTSGIISRPGAALVVLISSIHLNVLSEERNEAKSGAQQTVGNSRHHVYPSSFSVIVGDGCISLTGILRVSWAIHIVYSSLDGSNRESVIL